MPRQTFDSLDAEIAARETQQQQEAELRKYLVAEVQGLQSALESINSKMAAVKQENVSLAQENIALSAYIDSLMANVHEFGSKIASDTKPKSFLKRFSLGGRRQSVKVVKQGDNIGELETKPERNAPRGGRSSMGGGGGAAGSSPGGRGGSACFDLASAPLSGLSAPLGAVPRLTPQAAASSPSLPPGGSPPPPPPPPVQIG